MPKKTRLEKIEALRAKARIIDQKIKEIQASCKHQCIKTVHEAVGYNGYSTDYVSRCSCAECDKHWFHDGYCSGGWGHE